MTLLAIMLFVGAGSYLMRLLPLLFADRIRLSPAVERFLGDGALGALAALLATAVERFVSGSLSPGLTPAAGYAALGVGAAIALRGASIGRVVLAGSATTAIVVVVAKSLL